MNVKLVKMIRDAAAGEPSTADVHPNEVEAYKRADWRIAPEPEKPEKQESKKK